MGEDLPSWGVGVPRIYDVSSYHASVLPQPAVGPYHHPHLSHHTGGEGLWEPPCGVGLIGSAMRLPGCHGRLPSPPHRDPALALRTWRSSGREHCCRVLGSGGLQEEPACENPGEGPCGVVLASDSIHSRLAQSFYRSGFQRVVLGPAAQRFGGWSPQHFLTSPPRGSSAAQV